MPESFQKSEEFSLNRKDGAERPEQDTDEVLELDAPMVYLDDAGRSFGDFAKASEEALRAGNKDQEYEIRDAQAKFLYETFSERYPDVLQIPREINGFYFFEINSDNARAGAKAGTATLNAIDAYKDDPGSDRWKEIVDENKELILSEYRINIRPQKEYVPEAIERLLKMFENSPELKDSVSSFKVKIGPSAPNPDKPDEAYTEIVLYAKNDPTVGADGKTGSRQSLEILLPAVQTAVDELRPYAERSPIKRKSQEINELITVAQASGDFKGMLQRIDKAKGTHYLDEYFDKDTGYAFSAGEEPLTDAARAMKRDQQQMRQVKEDLEKL